MSTRPKPFVNPSLRLGMSAASFFKRHWQKKPLLVRQALPGFSGFLSPDELAGLALEPSVKSRLVRQGRGRHDFRLTHGPFNAEIFGALPDKQWTVLVSGVNQLLPEASAMLDEFAFLPAWRLDDLMVSYATDQGGVGPHTDNYDVFLIQGAGRRQWQIAQNYDPRLVPDLDIKVLRNFVAEETYILEPGDMLYLPPGVAHHGVSLGPSISYSVGFRSKEVRDLMGSLLDLPEPSMRTAGFYEDPDLQQLPHPLLVDGEAVRRLRKMAMERLGDDELMGRWLAAAVTRDAPPYQWFPGSFEDEVGKVKDHKRELLLKALAKYEVVWRPDEVRLAISEGGDVDYLFIGGEEMRMNKQVSRALKACLARRTLNTKAVLKALPGQGQARREVLSVLVVLKQRGALCLA